MEKKFSAKLRYPNQICSFKRRTLVLGVDCMLFLPKEDDPPLQMHAGYSRLVLSIVDKRTENTNVVTANLPFADISGVAHKIKLVYDDKFLNRKKIMREVEKNKQNAVGDNVALAGSETFHLGSLKGKTPKEVILTQANGKEAVRAQMAYLEAHLKDYPGNKKIIDACAAAIAASDAGLLNSGDDSDSVGDALIKTIYQSALKYRASKKNKDGKYAVYSISISCDYAKDTFPWCVSIVNGWSDVEIKPDGSVNVSPKISERSSSAINLSDDEILFFADRIESTLRSFETANFRHQYAEADKIGRTLRNSETE